MEIEAIEGLLLLIFERELSIGLSVKKNLTVKKGEHRSGWKPKRMNLGSQVAMSS